MHLSLLLSLLTTFLAFLPVISATPLEWLHTNNVTTQAGPILPRGSIIPLKPADHFPSELEIVQSINAYSMLLVCQFFRQGSFCDSPLNNVDEFLAFTGHLHDVLECHFKPGGKHCATNENVVVSMYSLFEYVALLPDSPTSSSISSSSSTAASSTASISSSPSTATFPTVSVSVAPSPMSTSAIPPNSTRTSSSLVTLSSFTTLATATSLSTLTSRQTWISLSTVTSLSTSTFLLTSNVPVSSVPSSTPSTSLSNSTVTVPPVPSSTPPISLATLTLSLTSTVRVPSVPSSTPFSNGNLTMKRTVQRADDGELKPLAQGKAAQLNETAAVPGNDSTSDTSSFERKGALPGIIVNAAANAITTTVQDAIAEDEQEDAKKGSEGKREGTEDPEEE